MSRWLGCLVAAARTSPLLEHLCARNATAAAAVSPWRVGARGCASAAASDDVSDREALDALGFVKPEHVLTSKKVRSELSSVLFDREPSPWIPSHMQPKQKRLTKRAKHILQVIDREQVAHAKARGHIDDFKAGDIIEVVQKTPEAQNRLQTMKGICIARRNRGMGSSFTIRNVYFGRPLEMSFPLYSPLLQRVTMVKRGKTRRKKLYYLRDKALKQSQVDP